MESIQIERHRSPKERLNRYDERNMIHIKLPIISLNNNKEKSSKRDTIKYEEIFGKDEAMSIPRIQNMLGNIDHLKTSQITDSFAYEDTTNKNQLMKIPRVLNTQEKSHDITTSPIIRDHISYEDQSMKIPRVFNIQGNNGQLVKSISKDNLVNHRNINNEFHNDEVFNRYKRREISDSISHDQESRLYSLNKSAISLNETHNDESFKREFADREVMDEIDKRKSLQGTWPKCNEKLIRNDATVYKKEKSIYKQEKAIENDNLYVYESDKHLKISQQMMDKEIPLLKTQSKTFRKMYEENSNSRLTSRNSEGNDILYNNDKSSLNIESLNDKCDQFNILSDEETRSTHHEQNELKSKYSQLTNDDNKNQILLEVNNMKIGQCVGYENNNDINENENENEHMENDDNEYEIGKCDDNQSSREIHMKALSELQASSALRARPDVVYGTMIPEPDYSDEEVDSKSTNTSSPNKMVVRNNRVNANVANNSPQKENKCNTNERFDDKGLILPKKLPNPCKDSTEKKSLHRELLFNQKVGVSVLNQKSELQKALEKHKGKQALKEQEKEKQTQLTPLQRAIDERAQRLEKSAKEEEKEKDSKDETETSSEFQKIHANFDQKSKRNNPLSFSFILFQFFLFLPLFHNFFLSHTLFPKNHLLSYSS